MDPASAAVALLSAYLAKVSGGLASQAADATLAGTRALLEAIRRKFSGSDGAAITNPLGKLEETPTDEERLTTLESSIRDMAERDADFAKELGALVAAATGGQPVTAFLTQVYGGQVGSIVNVQTAGDLHFGA